MKGVDSLIRAIGVLFLFFFTYVIAGCATPQVYLDRAIIRNGTRDLISEVRVHHEPTNRIGAVQSILPESSFELGFSAGPMLAKRSTITWKEKNGKLNTAKLELPVLDTEKQTSEQAKILVYTIQPGGSVSVELKE